MINKITKLFPLWAVLLSGVALLKPELFAQLKALIVPLLAVIMFTMGLTLTTTDFVRVLKTPKPIFIGVIIQYTIMPLTAYFISVLLGLEKDLIIGMVLVGSVAGGTASNVICFLAGGNVALSVTMTTVSTLLAFIFTPLLTLLYAGQYIPVPVLDMLLSIIKIVLFPLVLGVIANKYFEKQIIKVSKILPLLSIISIVVIIAIVVALNNQKLLSIGYPIVIAVIGHNLVGLTAGYSICKLLGYNSKICKTISIEVGMQNSGLAVALAAKYFTALSALPGAVFSVWHNISGSILASFWSTNSIDKKEK